MKRARMTVLLLSLAVAGCGTSADFQQPVTRFAEATGRADGAVRAFDAGVAAQLTQLRREEAAEEPDRVVPVEQTCSPGAAGCEVLLASDSGPGVPLTVTTAVPQHLLAMAEIRRYANGLDEIVQADATPAVKAGLDKASAAAASLAAMLGPQYAPAVKAFSVAVTQAVVWAVGEYQERIKLDALREATGQMQPILAEAVTKFGDAADMAQTSATADLYATFNDRRVAFQTAASVDARRQQLPAYLDAAQRLDDSLRVKPGEVYRQLGTAHGELHDALHSRDLSFAEARHQIELLAAKAKELQAIAKAFKEAAAASAAPAAGASDGQ